MSVLKLVRKKADRAVEVHALALEINQAINRYSTLKRNGGQEALKQSVSFGFMDKPPVVVPRSFFQRRGLKSKSAEPSGVAWLVGYLQYQGNAGLYIDKAGHGYLTTTPQTLRVPSDVWLLTTERLNGMTLSQLKEIWTLLRKQKN